MVPSQKTHDKPRGFFRKSLRGLSLLEAILALGIGGIVITQSVFGLSKYTSGVQVQAVASKLAILNRAADRFAEDNYANLLAGAPQELPVSVLEPYVGENIGPDAFGNTYKLTTRTYQITVPDPVNGGTKNESALQVLVMGEFPDPASSPMTEDLTLRTDIANTAGAAAGFIAKSQVTCSDGAGGTRSDGDICGAFGSFSLPASDFSATNFDNAAVVSLVTKGDSSVYGDQLYRYDYGDPELNTMHTSLYMEDNDIVSPGDITDANRITLDGGAGTDPAVIRATNAKDLHLEAEGGAQLATENGGITLNASNNKVTLAANPVGAFPCAGASCTNDFAQLDASNGKMRINNSETVFGDKQVFNFGGQETRTGTGNIWANTANLTDIQTSEINSLFATRNSVLRLQKNRLNGEVIIGNRVRYNPKGANGTIDGGIYELSDGDLTAKHISVRDITCADCGGSLAAILPKWRHMGTYFIPSGTQSRVPKPNCKSNRTYTKNRPADGTNLPYMDSQTDGRYEAKIIVIPRQMAFQEHGGNALGIVKWRFMATDAGNEWVTWANSLKAEASALAKTYCVFVGGNPDPTAAHFSLPSTPGVVENSNFQWLEQP